MVLMLLSFGIVANAQSPPLFPYEGATHTYACNGITEGADYEFRIAAKTGDVLAGDFDFIGDYLGTIGNDGIASVQIQWNIGSSLKEYAVWLEVNTSGCSNKIFLGVSPQPNNRSVGFDVLASTECFNLSDNSFTLSFVALDNNGQPLSAAHYPMLIEFGVNGNNQNQTVDFNNQNLQISENWFTVDPTQNTEVLVEITNVTDKYNAPINPESENTIHTRTFFAIPEIEFTEELRLRYNLNEEITAYNISSNTDHILRMEPK